MVADAPDRRVGTRCVDRANLPRRLIHFIHECERRDLMRNRQVHADEIQSRQYFERALQFVRSAPGITTALVGMSRAEHAKANTKLVSVPPATSPLTMP